MTIQKYWQWQCNNDKYEEEEEVEDTAWREDKREEAVCSSHMIVESRSLTLLSCGLCVSLCQSGSLSAVTHRLQPHSSHLPPSLCSPFSLVPPAACLPNSSVFSIHSNQYSFKIFIVTCIVRISFLRQWTSVVALCDTFGFIPDSVLWPKYGPSGHRTIFPVSLVKSCPVLIPMSDSCPVPMPNVGSYFLLLIHRSASGYWQLQLCLSSPRDNDMANA